MGRGDDGIQEVEHRVERAEDRREVLEQRIQLGHDRVEQRRPGAQQLAQHGGEWIGRRSRGGRGGGPVGHHVDERHHPPGRRQRPVVAADRCRPLGPSLRGRGHDGRGVDLRGGAASADRRGGVGCSDGPEAAGRGGSRAGRSAATTGARTAPIRSAARSPSRSWSAAGASPMPAGGSSAAYPGTAVATS
ncbi:hypothetical protein KIF24_13660 [Micromonospora sp. Llam7]|uniref:hypothetical protein n=1 Tax=Micromonospora tarapacensis TaxID=2835305 RepID=UPI001C83F5C4|nr:hypothetical protein [Micromonospora tarapacensis]MBX7266971.1 hypothetical protein [Micromonospora tarapacensis]